MSALSESTSTLDRGAARLLQLVREELAPYPGRLGTVTRMVISSVIIMILVMTFRIPGAALAGYYTLLLSRESPRATLAGAVELVLSFAAGICYVLLSSLIFFGDPVLHFIWVIVSLFVIFFGMATIRSYSAAAGFGFLIATCIPVWDRVQPSEQSFEATLWIAGSVTLGAAVTVAVEYVWAPFQRHGLLEEGLLDRWTAMSGALRALALGDDPGQAGSRLTQFATVGTSRLRRIILRSGREVDFIEQAATVLSVTEHLVDLTASLLHIQPKAADDEKNRLSDASTRLRALETSFRSHGFALKHTPHVAPDETPTRLPLLTEIERYLAMLEESFTEGDALRLKPAAIKGSARPSLFTADAWTNPDHLRFALKGCLAASICYVVYNAIGWPGLNTSVATCIVTALSSIGSSRQKQILRISGAIAGGVVFGMGAQALVLPYIDSITEFALLFAVVTAIAAWCSTSSARLSYFGLQIALAFFLINLQEFSFQTSLTIARDRVFGILLGLVAMWLVFDLLGGLRAADLMVARFKQGLLLLAELQELSLVPDANAIARRVQEIREDLITIFAAVNTEADGIVLETGSQRAQHLAVRERILAMQASARSLLLLQVTTLQYRRQKLLHELPEQVAAAQRNFDNDVSTFLRELAETFPEVPDRPTSDSFLELREAIFRHYRATAEGMPSAAARAIVSLSEQVTATLESMRTEGLNRSGNASPLAFTPVAGT